MEHTTLRVNQSYRISFLNGSILLQIETGAQVTNVVCTVFVLAQHPDVFVIVLGLFCIESSKTGLVTQTECSTFSIAARLDTGIGVGRATADHIVISTLRRHDNVAYERVGSSFQVSFYCVNVSLAHYVRNLGTFSSDGCVQSIESFLRNITRLITYQSTVSQSLG